MTYKKYQILLLCPCIIFVLAFSASAQFPSEEPLSLKEQKDKEGYVVNLKDLIKKSKKKIEQVNNKIKDQARMRRNQQREEKAKEYYNKAMSLYQDGKLKEAQQLWEKAIKITEHPEMKGYVRESVRRAKKQEEVLRKEKQRRLKRLEIERGYSSEEVERVYQQAVSLFKKKKWLDAKGEFDRVDDMYPDHKATRSYLMVIDQEIAKEQEQLIVEKLKEEAIERRKEKEQWRKNLERKEQERQEGLKLQAELAYKNAMKLYKVRQYERAKEKFKEVEWVLPNFKKTVYYLSRIDRDIREDKQRRKKENKKILQRQIKEEQTGRMSQQERIEKQRQKEQREKQKRLGEETAFVYKAAVSLYKNKFYSDAQLKFFEVDNMIPDYKATSKYLKKIESKLQKQEKIFAEAAAPRKQEKMDAWMPVETVSGDDVVEKAVLQRQQKLNREAEAKFKEALRFFNTANYPEAKRKFIQVEALSPGYKETLNYLSLIDEQMLSRADMVESTMTPVKTKTKSWEKERTPQKAKTEKRRYKKVSNQSKDVVDVLYTTARSFYKTRQYYKAKNVFLEVNALVPNYKGTKKYLKRIKQRIRKQRQQIDQGVEPRQAYIPSDKQDNIDRLQIREDMKKGNLTKKQTAEDRRRIQKQLLREVKDSYLEALNFYRDGNYENAKEKFLLVESRFPGYKSAKNYVKHCDKALDREAVKTRKKIARKREEEEKVKKKVEIEFRKTQKEKIKELKRLKREEDMAQLESDRKQMKLDREKQRLEEKKQKQAMGRLKKETKEVYRQALEMYRLNRMTLAQEKFNRYEYLLRTGHFDTNYIKKMRQRLVKDREKIEKKLKQEREQREKIALERREELKQLRIEHFKINQKEIKKLDKKIQREEKRISAKQKQAELEKVVKQRQRDLKRERVKNKMELEKNLQKIYQRAVKMHRSKSYQEARRMFLEVERIHPGYKKTNGYLAKIKKKIGAYQEPSLTYKGKKIFKDLPMGQRSQARNNIVSETLDAFEQQM